MHTGQYLHERRFTRAVFAEQSMHFTRPQREITIG